MKASRLEANFLLNYNLKLEKQSWVDNKCGGPYSSFLKKMTQQMFVNGVEWWRLLVTQT